MKGTAILLLFPVAALVLIVRAHASEAHLILMKSPGEGHQV